ncbi:MAG: peptidylprolyl isomerase [Wenzhouxiangella sp.]|nr:peptidylprolyl isomerase [Wenzhouxiangella sp.]
MNQVAQVFLPAVVVAALSFPTAGQAIDKTLTINYDSPVLVQKGNVSVSLADFVAYLDWRVPKDEQRGVLASPSRIEGILDAIVLTEAFMHRVQGTDALDEPNVQARIYQAAAREARNIYRERLTNELELDSYEKQAKELFMLDQERFTRRETIDFDHVLIAVDEDRDEVSAMRRAADAYDALIGGQSFAEVAASYSDDPGFPEHRGKFEGIDIETLVPSVAQAADTLEVGTFSVPIQSRFGWHIFRITSVNESGQMSWEEAQPIAERIARERHLSKAYERELRDINSAPMQFADGAVNTILDHYGIEGFGMSISESDDGTDAN